jgi:hypothetical protein
MSAVASLSVVTLLTMAGCGAASSDAVDAGIDGNTAEQDDAATPASTDDPQSAPTTEQAGSGDVDPDREVSIIVYWADADADLAVEAVGTAGGRVVDVVEQLGYLVAAFDSGSGVSMDTMTADLEAQGLRIERDIVSKDPTTGG